MRMSRICPVLVLGFSFVLAALLPARAADETPSTPPPAPAALTQSAPAATPPAPTPAPPPPAAPQPATKGDLEKGQLLLEQAAAAVGTDGLNNLKDFTYRLQGTYKLAQGELKATRTVVRKFPDCEWSELRLPMGVNDQGACGKKGWRKSGQGVLELTPEAMRTVIAARRRDLLIILAHPQKLKAAALPDSVSIDGKPADAARVEDEEVENWKIFFDRETHLIVRQEYTDLIANGSQLEFQENYADYRGIGAVQWPYQWTILRKGKLFATLAADSVAVNTGVDQKIFKKPRP
jgi:hypothetical protein